MTYDDIFSQFDVKVKSRDLLALIFRALRWLPEFALSFDWLFWLYLRLLWLGDLLVICHF